MSWGYECRSKLIKQNPPKPTTPRQTKKADIPGPNKYEPPRIVGGKGYSQIKRAPAYSFGMRTPVSIDKPAVLPRAPMVNIEYMSKKGYHKIPGGLMGEKDNPIHAAGSPGPAAYLPQPAAGGGGGAGVKRPPAYSMAKPARPAYEPFDMWTPSPNMYCPPIPGKSDPAFSFGYTTRHLSRPMIPGPGDHEPKFDYVKTTKPAFSFGAPFREPPRSMTPAPNTYCEKKFKYIERRGTAPSFGIRHTPFLGKQAEYLRSSKLDLITSEP